MAASFKTEAEKNKKIFFNLKLIVFSFLQAPSTTSCLKHEKQVAGSNREIGISGSMVKNLPAKAGDMGLIPGSGRSPGE